MTIVRSAISLGLASFALLLAACETTGKATQETLNNAFTDYSARRFDDAEKKSSAYIKDNADAPDVAEAYYLRGLANYGQGDRANAAKDLNVALAKTQRADLKAKSLRVLGDMAFEGRRYEQAIDYYTKSIQADPTNRGDVHATYRLGAALQAIGEWDKARPLFQQIISNRAEGDQLLLNRSLQRVGARSFSLQFGAFKEGPRAADMVRDLKTAGINARVSSELRDEVLMWLVQAGSYRTMDEAEFERTKLQAKFPLLTIVP